jgi:hypothetical protein
MGSLLYEVVPRSLAAAIRPVIFLLHLNTLTGPTPVARGAALTAGAAVVLIVRSTMSVSIRDRTRRGDAKGDPKVFVSLRSAWRSYIGPNGSPGCLFSGLRLVPVADPPDVRVGRELRIRLRDRCRPPLHLEAKARRRRGLLVGGVRCLRDRLAGSVLRGGERRVTE